MTALSLVLSLVLLIGGLRLMGQFPDGMNSFSSGAFALVLFGVFGLVSVYSRGAGRRQPLNGTLKIFLAVLAFFLMFFGVILSLLSLGGAFAWSDVGPQTLCLALMVPAGALCLLLLSDPRRDAAREVFGFATGEKFIPRWGFTGLRHVYSGDRNGIPFKASVTVGSVDKRGLTRYVVEVVCLIDNPHDLELLAYADGFPVRRGVSHLAKIPKVPYWNGYVVRGRPADVIPGIITPFRKTPVTVFSEAYGFERVRVSGNEVHGRFVLHGSGENYRLGDIVDGLAFFAGHFN